MWMIVLVLMEIKHEEFDLFYDDDDDGDVVVYLFVDDYHLHYHWHSVVQVI
jgi:hypothetical protein